MLFWQFLIRFSNKAFIQQFYADENHNTTQYNAITWIRYKNTNMKANKREWKGRKIKRNEKFSSTMTCFASSGL